MKRKLVLMGAFLFALAILWKIPSVWACEPDAETPTMCHTYKLFPPIPTPAPMALSVPAKPVKPVPQGTSPFDAMDITNAWQTLAGGARRWYKIDNGDNFSLDVWLDANGRSGVTFAAYAPEQLNQLATNLDIPPKGRGAPLKQDPSHDLMWSGAQARGVWSFLVTNSNPFQVDYRLGSRQSTEERNCNSYWEWIGTSYVYWTACR